MKPDAPTALAAENLGTTLGPVFICFAHLLLRHTRKLKCRRLGFLARDGDLLLHVLKCLPCIPDDEPRPELTYLHLSRRSTTLPACRHIDATSLSLGDTIHTGTNSWRHRLSYLGLTTDDITHIFVRHGINPDATNPSPAETSNLLADQQFLANLESERLHQRDRLAHYLTQTGIGRNPPFLLVDIGWRGSILRNLENAFGSEPWFDTPPGAFIGLWTESGKLPDLPQGSIGLISDFRRSRRVREGAAWYAAFLLEAICRADEGTVIGYSNTGREIVPQLAGDSPSRIAERNSANITNLVRNKILNYVAEHGALPFWQRATDIELRQHAQEILQRLAFFPSIDEITVGTSLIHTEGHDPTWATPLIDTRRPHPLLAPRSWLAGLSSPWRAGYIQSTGGNALATCYQTTEDMLLALPAPVRTGLTRIAKILVHSE